MNPIIILLFTGCFIVSVSSFFLLLQIRYLILLSFRSSSVFSSYLFQRMDDKITTFYKLMGITTSPHRILTGKSGVSSRLESPHRLCDVISIYSSQEESCIATGGLDGHWWMVGFDDVVKRLAN